MIAEFWDKSSIKGWVNYDIYNIKLTIFKSLRMLNSVTEIRDHGVPLAPTNIAATIYVTDLPRNTSYNDLADFFERNGGPCNITIKR
jgi:RNA recognition motif-containing protein